jgi:hypothetical protein
MAIMREAPILTTICLLGLTSAGPAALGALQPPVAAHPAVKQPPAKPRVAITISPETTRLTEPFREDGYVDYVAALNARCSEGVTPQNNGAVLFWQAMGPAALMDTYPRAEQVVSYYRMLGISRLPKRADCFARLEEFAIHLQADSSRDEAVDDGRDRRAILEEHYEQALSRPWSRAEFPALAEWMKRNERPLSLLRRATKKPRFYMPLVDSQKTPPVLTILLVGTQESRRVARALKARAMLRLQEGKVDEAWEDLMACHRLARQVGGGFCLRRLPRLLDLSEKIDVGERYACLDAVSTIAREGPGAFGAILDAWEEQKELSGGVARSITNAVFDWDEILRMGNVFYDRLVRAVRLTDPHQRRESFRAFERELKGKEEGWSNLTRGAWLKAGSPRAEASHNLADVLLALLAPAVDICVLAEDRIRVTQDMTDVALALAAYRSRHGYFPALLSQLTPEYLTRIPSDPFGVDPIRYVSRGPGYLLYSVGPNGNDDNGRTPDSQPPGDDVVIRTPQTTDHGDQKKTAATQFGMGRSPRRMPPWLSGGKGRRRRG